MRGKIKGVCKQKIEQDFKESLKAAFNNPHIIKSKKNIYIHTHLLFAYNLMETLYNVHNVKYSRKIWYEGIAKKAFELPEFRVEIKEKSGKNYMIAGTYSFFIKNNELIQALKRIEKSVKYYDIILPSKAFFVKSSF